MTMKTQPRKISGMQQKWFLEEVHTDTFLPQKQEKSQTNNLNYHFKKSEEKRKEKKT